MIMSDWNSLNQKMVTKYKLWKNLTQRRYDLISIGSTTEGTYDPNQIMYLFDEGLTCKESVIIEQFLKWMYTNKKGMGWGNFEKRWQEFSRWYNKNN